MIVDKFAVTAPSSVRLGINPVELSTKVRQLLRRPNVKKGLSYRLKTDHVWLFSQGYAQNSGFSQANRLNNLINL
jgi:hypothetical protein